MTAADLAGLLAADLTHGGEARGMLEDWLKEEGRLELTPNGWRVLDGTATAMTLTARDRRLARKLIVLALSGDWPAFWALVRRSGRPRCSVSPHRFEGHSGRFAVNVSLGRATLLHVRVLGEAWPGMAPRSAFVGAGMLPA